MLVKCLCLVQHTSQTLSRGLIHATSCVAAILVVVLGAVATQASGQTIVYVNASASTGGNGVAWATAYRDLQSALDEAAAIPAASRQVEIRVAGGRYVPTRRSNPGDPRSVTFSVPDRTTVIGGFAGTELRLEDRRFSNCVNGVGAGGLMPAPCVNETVLDGDIARDDVFPFQNQSDNAYTVMVVAGNTIGVGLDGLTIRGGNGRPGIDSAGGISIGSSVVTMQRCTLFHNRSGGGAIFISGTSGTLISQCRFLGNQSPTWGAAIMLDGSPGNDMDVGNSTFVGNVALETNPATGFHGGGAIFADNRRIQLSNCTFVGNSTGTYGGAVLLTTANGSNIDNCLFWDNTAALGGGAIWTDGGEAVVLTCSTDVPVQGPGPRTTTGTLAIDPIFVPAVRSGVDGFLGTPDDNVAPAAGSLCIDGGNMTRFLSSSVSFNTIADVDGKRRLVDATGDGSTIVDIGALEVNAPPYSPVVYVNASLTGGSNNGSSWANAFRGGLGLRNALTYIASQPTGAYSQLWVAAGTYKPSQSLSQGGSRSASFNLQNNLAIYGGFQGNETSLTQRNIVANPSILSGDLNGDDNGDLNRNENSYHVVRIDTGGSEVFLDGFSIRSGNANGGGLDEQGGGILITNAPSRSQVRNCIIERNKANASGGGVYIRNTRTDFIDCIVRDNVAQFDGGGIAVDFESGRCDLTRCQILSNRALLNGGGVLAANRAVVTLLSCNVQGNNAGDNGGGLFAGYGTSSVNAVLTRIIGNTSEVGSGVGAFQQGRFTLDGCVIAGNNATDAVAIYVGPGAPVFSSGIVRACTIAGNRGGRWGGVIVEGTPAQARCLITNSVVFGNSGDVGTVQDQQVLNFENTAILDISYSTLQGWTGSLGGTNNNGLDPLFLRTPSPGPDTIWGTTDDDYGDLRLSSNSPAIDSGDSLAVPADTYDIDNDGNTTEALPLDLAGQPRFYDDPTRSNTGNGNPPVDRGAYENNLATTVWNAPTGGRFDLAANWFGGVPASTVRAIFNSDVGLNRVYTVTMPTNQSAYSLSVLSNLVTINLRGLTTSGNLTLASPGSDQNAPSLLISGPATVPTGLSITNTGTSLRSVFGSNAVVAAASDSAGELTVSGLRASLLLSDSLDAGLAGSASLRVINRGQLSSATLRTGVNAGATSTVLVSGVSGAGDSLLALGGPGADELVISSRGTTTMQVQNEGVVAGLDALDRTVFAEYAGSVANVTMSGANTIWDTSQDDLIISRGGTTNLVVTNGATMNTATANRIVLGELEGSVANITIGPGSSWNESVQSVVLAGQGAANINMLPGSALNFQSNLVINPAGSISGSGTITGGVFNVGTVRVGNSPGELTIVGDYRQLPAQNDPDPARANRSGSLEMEIAGTAPGQYDRLIVSGDVDLGGGLVVNLAPQVVLPESGTLQIITGARGNTRFDVALLPTLGLDRFARVVYGDADEPISIGVQPIQAPFSPGEPRGTPVSGTPSAVIVADFNADGAPDLAIAVPNITPGSAGQAFVFRNAGVSGGVWQGFQSVLQLNTGIDPSDIDAADLDGDGLIDLVVSNRGSDSLSRFQNTSLGSSFLTQPTIAVGDGPSSVSATVLYNDAGTNLPDLIVSNETAGTIQLLRSNDAIGGPTITPQQTITVPGRPRRTRPIDLDDDKRNEAVSMIVSDGSAGSVNAVIPMVRVSPTLYGLLAPVPVADDPQDLVVSNISAVPTPDVAVVCASGAISVLRNQLLPDQPIGSQPFAPAVNLPVQGAGLDIAAYDIDADGDNDLVVVLSDVVRDVYTLRNLTDDPTTISLATPLAADTGANPLLVAGADVDGSGVFDVIHLGPPPPGRCPECLGGDNLFVLLPVAPTGCDSVDFNNNGVFPEDQDVVDFIDVLAGGTPSTCNATLGCQDIDFNNNGVFPEDQDVIDFFNVLAGGSCP